MFVMIYWKQKQAGLGMVDSCSMQMLTDLLSAVIKWERVILTGSSCSSLICSIRHSGCRFLCPEGPTRSSPSAFRRRWAMEIHIKQQGTSNVMKTTSKTKPRGRRIAIRRKWNKSSQCLLQSDPLSQDICGSFSLKILAENDTCCDETSHCNRNSENSTLRSCAFLKTKPLTQFVPFSNLGCPSKQHTTVKKKTGSYLASIKTTSKRLFGKFLSLHRHPVDS